MATGGAPVSSASAYREVPMGGPEFTIRYPLFALRRGSDYLAFDMARVRPPGSGTGILVFTTPEHVVRYMSHTRTEARVVRFDNSDTFRQLVALLHTKELPVLFDVLPDGSGGAQPTHVYPPGVLLDRFLPEPMLTWVYPLYVLARNDNLLTYQGERDGVPGRFLVAFTDQDLADRAVATQPEPMTARPVADPHAFARLLRALPAEVIGVLFDPPALQTGRRTTAVLRRDILAILDVG